MKPQGESSGISANLQRFKTIFNHIYDSEWDDLYRPSKILLDDFTEAYN